MSPEFITVLERLDVWLSQNFPAVFSTLRPGVSEEELDAFERILGQALPMDFRQLYLWHDGQEDIGYKQPQVTGVFGSLEFQPLASVQKWYENWLEDPASLVELNELEEGQHTSHPSGHVQEQYINLGWVAFATSGSATYLAVDLSPGPLGERGQVINFGEDDNDKYVLGRSLEAFVTEYLARLEAGRVQLVQPFDDGYWSMRMDHQNPEDGGIPTLFPGFGSVPR